LPVTTASTSYTFSRRRFANASSPPTISLPTAPSAYSSAPIDGDSASNSIGRPTVNWWTRVETRMAARLGAQTRSVQV
jgi:hypothetical protein